MPTHFPLNSHYTNPTKKPTQKQKMCFSPNHHLIFLLHLLPLLVHANNLNNNNHNHNTNLPKSESDALFAILGALSGQSWRATHPNPPCQPHSPSAWPGIHCVPGSDGLLHVSHLEFGTPPNPPCKPNSTFPPLIFSSFPHLTSLIFFKCFTSSKTTISFSSKSHPSSQLEQLSLRSNPALVGPIPREISSFTSLKILTLSQNRLTGAIPPEIAKLTSLAHLDFSYNMLTGQLPLQLGNLKTLAGLDLSYNSFTGPIPATIGDMGFLQKLDLSSNLLTGSIPETVGKLKTLDFLDLSHNHFTGKFPSQMSNLQSLQYLIMDDNPLNVPLPEQIGELVKLQELRLANSGYRGGIPASISNLKSLTTLSLENNKLTGEIPGEIGDLPRIYHLNLSGNSLGGIVPFGVGFVSRLGKNLDLSGNPGLCLSNGETAPSRIGAIGVCGEGMKKKKSGGLRSGGSKIGAFPPIAVIAAALLCQIGGGVYV